MANDQRSLGRINDRIAPQADSPGIERRSRCQRWRGLDKILATWPGTRWRRILCPDQPAGADSDKERQAQSSSQGTLACAAP